jgi:hypothetical protein
MRRRLFLAFLAFSITVSAGAQVCVKCIARNCVGGLPAGYVNCGSNGNLCIQWTSCTSGGSPVAILQAPSILGQDAPVWHLAAIETHSSREPTPLWHLAYATVQATNERRSAVRR